MFLYYVSYFGQTVNTSREKFEYLVRRQEGAVSEGQHLLSLRLQPQLPKSLNNGCEDWQSKQDYSQYITGD